MNVKQLQTQLKQAEIAHAQYEKQLGHHDPNWAEWYADFIVDNTQRKFNFPAWYKHEWQNLNSLDKLAIACAIFIVGVALWFMP